MAIYVYRNSDGELNSWIPEDLTIAEAQASGQLASDATLAASNLSAKDNLPPLGPTVAWDPATKTTITVTAPTPPDPLNTFDFIMAFTATELDAIRASSDVNIKQFLFALEVTQGVNLNHSTIKNSLQYLVNHGLLTQARANAILSTTTSGAAGGM
jgi:hypothetical protein